MSTNRLLISYTSGSNTISIDSEEDYGAVVLEVNDASEKEVSNITSQEWYGINGEEVYIPKNITFKSYDITIKMGIKEDMSQDKDARDMMEDFINAIKGKLLTITQEHIMKTWKEAYLKKVSDGEIGEDWMTFDVVIRVCNP